MSRRVVSPRYQQRRQSGWRSILPFIIVVVVAVVLIVILISGSLAKPTTPTNTERDKTSLGNASAPVQVVEFGDYQCPACGSFYVNLEPTLVQNYVNPGKVYFTFIPFSFIGPESIRAAEAAYCAMDQGKFWDYHDTLYNNQRGENQGGFSDANLETFAQNLNLNMTDFKSCFEGNKYQQLVNDNIATGNSKNVQSTPSFFVDNKLVYQDTLLSTIDAELKAKGK